MGAFRCSIVAFLVAVAALAALAGEAAADHPDSGLRVVRPQVGPPLLTHGSDPVPPRPPRAARASAGGTGFLPGDAERPPLCAGDYFQQAIYARPSSSPSRYGTAVGQIRASVARMNAVLNAESLDSGGGSADYKFLCDGSGQISVASLVVDGTGFARIVSAARAAGFESENADYLIFFDATNTTACGTSSYISDERLIAANESNAGGGYGVIHSNCWATEIPMHEASHMMGAVSYGAPHSTGSGGHCYQENDVLCYSPDGGDRNQGGPVTNCAGAQRFDCGFDDYFDSSPEPGEYLSTHWNLGSSLNRFIAFSAPSGGLVGTLTGLVQSLLGGGKTSGAKSDVAGGPGEWRYFKIEVTRPARSLRVRLRPQPGAALSLYVRRLKAPTPEDYACRGKRRGGAVVCTIRKPRGGRWLAGVLSAGEAGASFRIDVRLEQKRRR